MRATPLFVALLFVLLGTVAVVPTVQAYHCGEGPGSELCRLAETAQDIRDHLVHCAKQKPPFLGDSWGCLPNPYP